MKYNKGRWISSFKDAMVALRALWRRTAAKARRLRVRYLKAAVQLHPLLAVMKRLS